MWTDTTRAQYARADVALPSDLTDGEPQSESNPSAEFADELWDAPKMSNSDLVQLRIRVIALENLVLALFANADEQQIALASEMIGSIMPRVGATPHPLTIHAASQMSRLIDRAMHLCE